MAEDICQLKYQSELNRRELIELKQCLLFDKPMSKFDELCRGRTLTSNDQMLEHLISIEQQYIQTTNRFHQQWNRLKQQLNSRMLLTILERRFENMTDKLRCVYQHRTECQMRMSNSHDPKTISFRPFYVTDLVEEQLPFTLEQQCFLRRGPTYVPPFRLYSRLGSGLFSMKDLIHRQSSMIKRQLTKIFVKYQVNIAASMDFTQKVQKLFNDQFQLKLSNDLCRRALHEQDVVRSIHRVCHKQQLVIKRMGNRRNLFYIGSRKQFDAHVDREFQANPLFEHLITLSEEHFKMELKIELIEMIYSMNESIRMLENKKALSRSMADRLQLNVNQVRLPYIYYLPETNDVSIDQ